MAIHQSKSFDGCSEPPGDPQPILADMGEWILTIRYLVIAHVFLGWEQPGVRAGTQFVVYFLIT